MLTKFRSILLAALLVCAFACPALAAKGLVDYAQTPWGTPREAVLKKLRRLGPVVQSEQSEDLVVALGSLSAASGRYQLKATYRFRQGKLYRIDLRPLAERGGLVPKEKLPELYRDLVNHHRAEFGSPRLADGKCGAQANCRRTEWQLDKGRSVLWISEVLEPTTQYVSVSCHSAALAGEIEKTAKKRQNDRRKGLFPGRKFF